MKINIMVNFQFICEHLQKSVFIGYNSSYRFWTGYLCGQIIKIGPTDTSIIKEKKLKKADLKSIKGYQDFLLTHTKQGLYSFQVGLLPVI